jgi:hypothetical protein
MEHVVQAARGTQLLSELPTLLLALVLQALLLCNAILADMLLEILPPLNMRRQPPSRWMPGLFEGGDGSLEVLQRVANAEQLIGKDPPRLSQRGCIRLLHVHHHSCMIADWGVMEMGNLNDPARVQQILRHPDCVYPAC